jgi:hypothetical protein
LLQFLLPRGGFPFAGLAAVWLLWGHGIGFTNLWPLAVLSFGENWHNMHHSDPACGRHGVDRGQVDLSAALIRMFERFGWVSGVRWPDQARLERNRRRACDATTQDLVPGFPGQLEVPDDRYGGVAGEGVRGGRAPQLE